MAKWLMFERAMVAVSTDLGGMWPDSCLMASVREPPRI